MRGIIVNKIISVCALLCVCFSTAYAKGDSVVRTFAKIHVDVTNQCPGGMRVAAKGDNSHGVTSGVGGNGGKVKLDNVIVNYPRGELHVFNEWTHYFEEKATCTIKVPAGKTKGRAIVRFEKGEGAFSCNPTQCILLGAE